jgi:hypothetical protein
MIPHYLGLYGNDEKAEEKGRGTAERAEEKGRGTVKRAEEKGRGTAERAEEKGRAADERSEEVRRNDEYRATGAGLVYPPRDTGMLTSHLLALLRDCELARRMGETGRERVEEHFNWRTIAHITQMAYVSVLERGRRPRR